MKKQLTQLRIDTEKKIKQLKRTGELFQDNWVDKDFVKVVKKMKRSPLDIEKKIKPLEIKKIRGKLFCKFDRVPNSLYSKSTRTPIVKKSNLNKKKYVAKIQIAIGESQEVVLSKFKNVNCRKMTATIWNIEQLKNFVNQLIDSEWNKLQ